jgi:hypothetical protein
MDTRQCHALVLALVLAASPLAAAVELAEGAPDRYVVQRGDTLWDIAGRFLREPWRWPEIWRRNPQVKDPDLIYPGDVLAVEYVAGQPTVRVTRGRGGTVKLHPEVRVIEADRAVPTIPIDAVGPFLTESRVVTDAELDGAPYVLSAGREHLVGVSDAVVYARRVSDAPGQRYGVYRRGDAYLAPDSGEPLGYQAIYVAEAVLEVTGDPASLYVTRAVREIQAGDRLLPLETDVARQPFLPRAPAPGLRGNIISVVDGVTQIGQYNVVAIDLGAREGIEAGHVLAVLQRGDVVVDPVMAAECPEPDVAPHPADIPPPSDSCGTAASAFHHPEVTLPDERAGLVMVFRPFERVSYALVMEATRAMHVADIVETP